ncbi:acylphosphatase [Roseibium aestuarii]|uniref:acylphosphatase n=1 Tax=Roseibium aestuarii TaxID=2600299 RepID=A0ABW4K0G0_9HYPH|nr:acylphosphatase [Roseibium aestuarii]
MSEEGHDPTLPGDLRIRVRGRVQGVGYREWTVRQARALKLRGWVRNRQDGSVEIRVAGEEESLRAFVSRLREGPALARVTDLQVAAPEQDGLAAQTADDLPLMFERRPTA